MRYALATAALLAALPVAGAAASLPARLAPGEPFPRIVAQAPTIESVAPGVEYGDYQLYTAIGPLAVHVVAVAPHRDDVHLGEVLADDALTSPGETVGSMAKRTGAVAGINGDYFDVGNTNRPTNIVVRNGVLLRMPRKRYALGIARDGSAQIAEFDFIGQLHIADRTVSLDGIDELPPPDLGTSLITPEYGPVAPENNLTLVSLAYLSGTPPLARFRVTGIADNLAKQPPGYYVAIGPSAYAMAGVPNPGDVVWAEGDLQPIGLDRLVAAIGGGPLVLHQGEWYDDPDGPNGGEYAKRIPCSGVAIAPDGTLFLVEVDGREPLLSVGIDRHELAALMKDLGASEGMAFDGGGSSTIAVRRLGDPTATIANVPSDGVERPVANGIFVYSTAPTGPPARLAARPGTIRAVAGADIALQLSALDAASHVVPVQTEIRAAVEPPSLGTIRDGHFIAQNAGTGRIVLRSGALAGEIGVEVARTPARLTISPAQLNVERNGTLALEAHAYDERGFALALPELLAWSASSGSIDAHGLFHAGERNAEVSVTVGGAAASERVTVGTHDVALAFSERAHFRTLPLGGEGSLLHDPSCATCLLLNFSFSGDEHAAYAAAELPLPPQTIGVEFDVLDDGSGARVRVALRNTINEQILVDATSLDQPGWRHVIVHFPPQAAQPAKLEAIYVLPPKGMQLSEGTLGLRNVRAVIAGAQ